MSIAERIVRAREVRGLTQEDLARRLGIVAKSVSRWEKGTAAPRSATLPALARELQVSLSWLLTGKDGAGERLERDDDVFVRHPSLREFVDELGHLYTPAVVAELETWAGLDGDAPTDWKGWRREADRIAAKLAERER